KGENGRRRQRGWYSGSNFQQITAKLRGIVRGTARYQHDEPGTLAGETRAKLIGAGQLVTQSVLQHLGLLAYLLQHFGGGHAVSKITSAGFSPNGSYR